MPLPTTKVIHPRWSDHNKPVSEGAMTATIRIFRDSVETVFNPSNGSTTPVSTEQVWEGPARIQNLRGARGAAGSVVTAEQAVTVTDYLVATPDALPPVRVGETGDYAMVVESEDPQLVGRYLTISAATFGSLIWERDLYCNDDQTRNNPKEV